MHLKTRSGIKRGNDEVENEDSDSVVLEKSNVLLMGPTGSGIYLVSFFFIRVLARGIRARKHGCGSRAIAPALDSP